MAGNVGTPGASVTSRVLALLTSFDERHRELSLSQLASRAELPQATAYRLVRELVKGEALIRTERGTYAIGRRMWSLGLLATEQAELRRIASPFLHDVYSVTHATVHLTIIEQSEALCIARLRGNRSAPVGDIGVRLPLHATAVGKVLLAHAHEDLRTQVMRSLKRVTPHTITHPGLLRAQLNEARRQRYATSHQEMVMGIESIAVPILRGDKVVAAFGVLVPELDRNQLHFLRILKVATRSIRDQLEREIPEPPYQ